MPDETKVHAVIGGMNHSGEDFDTVELFDCLSKAQAYADYLINQEGFDYTLMKVKAVNMESDLLV